MFSIVKQKRGEGKKIWKGFGLCVVASLSTFRLLSGGGRLQMNAAALWFIVGATNIEPGTTQSQDEDLEQLQSHCSSIVSTRKVKGHPCMCFCNREEGRVQRVDECGV